MYHSGRGYDGKRGYMCAGQRRSGVFEIICAQFFCEPKSALKNKVY